MSAERKLSKNWFQFNKGINSEQSEISMQDGYSVDEANYELLLDGSRRRRRRLAQESGGGTITTQSFNPATSTSQTYVWKNAGGVVNKNFIVHRIGSDIYFTDDSDGGSASVRTETYDLDALKDSNTLAPLIISQQTSHRVVATCL